jgi:hypothetical protein
MEVLYIMPENERSAIATGVLHIHLDALLKRHKPPTVLDTLASLLHEAGWEIVVSALESATQAAADEEMGGAQYE